MKLLKTAPVPDFDSYIAREDTTYIEREGEPLRELYDAGYLPYSSTKNLQSVFYSARSARVVLPEFELSSENRRIAKKFDGQFDKKRIPVRDFTEDEAFDVFVTGYFDKRHGPNTAPRERVELWMQSGLVSTIIEYKKAGAVAGYVLEAEGNRMRHYWYSAYDLALAKQSLGLWLILDCIRDAKATGVEYYYLGTVYGPKALYKTNFEPLEWHTGSEWSRDTVKLKELSRSEN
jgi:arginine-tRNA-protein transferase